MFEQNETPKSTKLIKNEETQRKEPENRPSNVDDTSKIQIEREGFEQKPKTKMTLMRSLISPPYSTPRFVFKRLKDFMMQILANRYSKPLEEVGNDFHQMESCVEALLALEFVQKFEFQLEDTDIIIDLVESFDKSVEDMSPPIAGILGPLEHVEPTLTIHLKDTASSSAASLVNIAKTLELKIVKLQVAEPEGIMQKKQEAKT